MTDKVKAGSVKDYLKKLGEPFRKPEEKEEEDKEEEEQGPKLEDLTPKKKVPKGFIDAAKSIRSW